MEQPMFTTGQRVVCVDSKEWNGCPLIEGATYTVVDPNVKMSIVRDDRVSIAIKEMPTVIAWQQRFVPEDFDRYADNEFHEALKGLKINF